MVVEMEATNDQDEYCNSLRCLRDSWRIGENKLMGLNETIAIVEEEISTLESHLEIMDAAINSESRVAEYGALYAQVVALHTTYTLEIETIVKHDWSITLATSLCDVSSGISGDKIKYVFGRSRGEDDSFAKLMRDLCLSLRISLSKKRRLVAELEVLGEREGAVKPLKHKRDIVARDVVTLEELETLLAHAQVGVSLKVGYVTDMEESAHVCWLIVAVFTMHSSGCVGMSSKALPLSGVYI
nr:hypothetical protein [Tanacetum cinerariifolium]